jgi:hypothetical protein
MPAVQETKKGSSLSPSMVSNSQRSIQNSELQVRTPPPGDLPTTSESQPRERDAETPPEETRTPTTEIYKEPAPEVLEHPVPVLDKEISAEVERTRLKAIESSLQTIRTLEVQKLLRGNFLVNQFLNNNEMRKPYLPYDII